MLNSLQSTIAEDEAFSTNLASYQTWINQNGQKATLNELSQNLDDARDRVSEYTFSGLAIAKYD